ncbi:MAG: hypothetical protein RI945_327 [Candidatus Parcubacteria bacterium]
MLVLVMSKVYQKLSEDRGKTRNFMELTSKAIQDLRMELKRIYGTEFELNNEELNEIGLFLLTSLAEGLKLKKNVIIGMLH